MTQTEAAGPNPAMAGSLEDSLAERHHGTHRIAPQIPTERNGVAEIWAYRELLFGLFHRDVRAIKNQTPTAWFWRILQPTFALIMYTLLFEHIGKVDFGSGVPYFFAMTAAMLPWTLFSQIVTGSVNSIASNAGIMQKVYFPRLILPLVSITNAVVDFLITAALLLGLLFYMGMPLSLNLLVVPFFALWALILGLGLGLWLAALNTLYRDIGQSLGYVIQIGFYFSPILYPASAIPERFRGAYHLNPLVGIIEGFRWAFLQTGAPPNWQDVVAFLLTVVFGLTAIWGFRRIERVIADII